MFIDLHIYDKKTMDYRHRNLMLTSIITFWATNPNDIEEGTTFDVGSKHIRCTESIDVVVLKMAECYGGAYTNVVNEIYAKVKRGEKSPRKRAPRKTAKS